MSVCRLIHHFSPNWNTSAAVGLPWIHAVPPRGQGNDSDDPLNFLLGRFTFVALSEMSAFMSLLNFTLVRPWLWFITEYLQKKWHLLANVSMETHWTERGKHYAWKELVCVVQPGWKHLSWEVEWKAWGWCPNPGSFLTFTLRNYPTNTYVLWQKHTCSHTSSPESTWTQTHSLYTYARPSDTQASHVLLIRSLPLSSLPENSLSAACLRATMRQSRATEALDLFTCKSVQCSSAREENRSQPRPLQIAFNEPTVSQNVHMFHLGFCSHDLFIILPLESLSSSYLHTECHIHKDGGLPYGQSTS